MENSTLTINSLLLVVGVLGTIALFYTSRKPNYRGSSHPRNISRSNAGHYNTATLESIMTKITPWIRHKNMHQNYFMSGRVYTVDKPLTDSSLVFIHHPRTGGSNMIRCLNNISNSYDLPMSPLMTSENRALWDSGNKITNKYKDRIKIHRGKFSFGMCENLNQMCSYVIFLRDPLERLISSHNHCQTFPDDEFCGSSDPRDMSLRSWILSQGNVLLKQLLFSPHFCNDDYLKSFNISSNMNSRKLSCWTKNNLVLDKLIVDFKNNITQYIVNNLHRMISFIGLSEELDLSLSMLEKSFKLPFTNCDFKSPSRAHLNKEIQTNRALNTNSFHQNDEEIEDENDDFVNFKDDLYIQEALSADYAIYHEAKRIFHIQKQMSLNSVR
ncbi:uncharacterized protein LOC127723265 [Mytilus californianus]|uniref:uncharacterized protein LOC127723265 n=1 Tax=Mytilus californianus TaxID=6549 RepID=UPI0022478C64|nr:uncharacterized protein LOC127723265 [Mytilus californianus]